ncbi:hypothetical protein FJU30_06810 [Affinibrenneria salicis]|uniref:DUF1883 domain-containing protein n=1 Tax=Affinibrenneria salicis TaxID=2590031 RepID=A0A5J5G522_9GAMM|nr:hypothetical protein [Affinibrenneria salicis]KAA9001983.1 hypothetical protein FJU30_06810 [Affinibrenneria salicis]
MSIVRTCLTLFGGDTLIIKCTDKFHVSMVDDNQSDVALAKSAEKNAISVDAKEEVYLTVPYTGMWDLIIDSKSNTPEHSISYFPA